MLFCCVVGRVWKGKNSWRVFKREFWCYLWFDFCGKSIVGGWVRWRKRNGWGSGGSEIDCCVGIGGWRRDCLVCCFWCGGVLCGGNSSCFMCGLLMDWWCRESICWIGVLD